MQLGNLFSGSYALAAIPPTSLPSRPAHANPPTSNEPEQRSPPTPIEYPASPIQQNLPPEVEALKAMFPDFDAETLCVEVASCYHAFTDSLPSTSALFIHTLFLRHSVLVSVGGNQERAADLLLGMSDPNYQSQEAAGPVRSAPHLRIYLTCIHLISSSVP
jgi:hypothetical protein